MQVSMYNQPPLAKRNAPALALLFDITATKQTMAIFFCLSVYLFFNKFKGDRIASFQKIISYGSHVCLTVIFFLFSIKPNA